MVARAREHTDTIAAIATPPGQGGVGIVKVSGPDSSRIITAICQTRPEPRRCVYTAFHDQRGQILDRGMALFFQGPDSHTGEDIAELHGHGGPVVMNLLLQRVLSLGARYARPGEFSERAFLNDKIDLLQAEAVADLISSASEQAAMSAVRSMEGLFSSLVEGLVTNITELRVFVEATLDFPEEEIDPFAETELQDRLAACRRAMADISAPGGNRAAAGGRLENCDNRQAQRREIEPAEPARPGRAGHCLAHTRHYQGYHRAANPDRRHTGQRHRHRGDKKGRQPDRTGGYPARQVGGRQCGRGDPHSRYHQGRYPGPSGHRRGRGSGEKTAVRIQQD